MQTSRLVCFTGLQMVRI